MFIVVTFMCVFLLLGWSILTGLYYAYMFTIKLAYEHGYNKCVTKEKINGNVEDYEDMSILSGLVMFPLYFVAIISLLGFAYTVEKTLATVLALVLEMVVNYGVIYKIGCRDGKKKMAV